MNSSHCGASPQIAMEQPNLELLVLIEKYKNLVNIYGVHSFGTEEFKILHINNLEFLKYSRLIDEAAERK